MVYTQTPSKKYDCVRRHRAIEKLVVRQSSLGEERLYYRFRRDRWYGGIFTSDCSGCGLLCKFCWLSEKAFYRPHQIGRYYSSVEVASRLIEGARQCGLRQLRISGGEPTIGRRHLLEVLDELMRQSCSKFILETNGILIGSERDYAEQLSIYPFLHVRVSFKGCSENEFESLTGAEPEGFTLQLQALRRLVEAGVSCHAAVMTSFSSSNALDMFCRRIGGINPRLANATEIEEVILYRQVVKRMKRYGIQPSVSHLPSSVPAQLV